jgi:hypothetical protein
VEVAVSTSTLTDGNVTASRNFGFCEHGAGDLLTGAQREPSSTPAVSQRRST